jgi:hypothetical protein
MRLTPEQGDDARIRGIGKRWRNWLRLRRL